MGESTSDKFPIKNSDLHNVARRENLVPVNFPKLRCTTRELLSFIATHLWIMTAVIKISESGTLSAIQVDPVELVTALMLQLQLGAGLEVFLGSSASSLMLGSKKLQISSKHL